MLRRRLIPVTCVAIISLTGASYGRNLAPKERALSLFSVLHSLSANTVLTAIPSFIADESFDAKVASVLLLESKAVQHEIRLTEAQRDAMNKYADAHRAKLNAYYQQLGPKGQPDEQKLLAMFKVMKEGVLAQLKPAQLKRLREISLQSLDFVALSDETVAQVVGLGADQERRIRKIAQAGITQANQIRNDAIKKATVDLLQKKPTTQQEQRALQDEFNRRAEAATNRVLPQIERLRVKARGEVNAILTPSQRAKWQELLGKHFDLQNKSG